LLTSKEETDLSKFKIGIGALVAGLLVAFGAFGLGAATPDAEADITSVYLGVFPLTVIQSEAFTDAGSCDDMPTSVSLPSSINVPIGAVLAICVNLDANRATTAPTAPT
jgi:hypothetical protein